MRTHILPFALMALAALLSPVNCFGGGHTPSQTGFDSKEDTVHPTRVLAKPDSYQYYKVLITHSGIELWGSLHEASFVERLLILTDNQTVSDIVTLPAGATGAGIHNAPQGTQLFGWRSDADGQLWLFGMHEIDGSYVQFVKSEYSHGNGFGGIDGEYCVFDNSDALLYAYVSDFSEDDTENHFKKGGSAFGIVIGSDVDVEFPDTLFWNIEDSHKAFWVAGGITVGVLVISLGGIMAHRRRKGHWLWAETTGK